MIQSIDSLMVQPSLKQRVPRLTAGLCAAIAALGLAACDDAGESVESGSDHAVSLPGQWTQKPAAEREALGFMSSLPIYWAEAASFEDMLGAEGTPNHWARSMLEQRYSIELLDVLTRETLTPHRYLLLAQPRALSPEENVALDDWLRSGGRLLLFADPMLSEGSRYAFGDQRRPQATILLSPILARWGLELTFDDQQSGEWREEALLGARMPAKLPGVLVTDEPAGPCTLLADGLAARCTLGEGQAVIVADAAMLEAGSHGHDAADHEAHDRHSEAAGHGERESQREAALASLVLEAFGE
jgi:hypothetical protein